MRVSRDRVERRSLPGGGGRGGAAGRSAVGRRAMRRLAGDEHLRSRLAEKGLARAAEFTWQRSAREHLRLFEKVAGAARPAEASA